MAKLTRVPAKVFAASAVSTEIGQFGSAVAGSKLETADVATIQGLSAWLDGWSEALVSSNRYPALQEMNGLLKVLSYQGAYALQEGIAEYDSATTYYIGSIVKKTGTFELYGSLTNDNVGNALTIDTEWKFLVDLNVLSNTLSNALIYTADTSNMQTLTNNVSDVNNDIDFGAGFCYDLSTNIKITNIALTKRLDATFVAGTNQGGLDTGTKAISTWYYCFAISKADGTSDFLYSLSSTAPTMPTDFVNKRRIGCVVTDASGNIRPFWQYGDMFRYKTRIEADVSVTLGTTATNYTLTVPRTTSVSAIIDCYASNSAGAIARIRIYNPSESDIAISTGANLGINAAGTSAVSIQGQLTIPTNSTAQIRAVATAASTAFSIYTVGYIDTRGVN